jgi:hypothetical protein
MALAEGPFASLQRMASKTLIPMMTAHHHLVAPLGITVTHLRCLLHRFSQQQKCSRVQKAQGLLAVFKSTRHNFWKNIITIGDSFFDRHTGYDHMWLLRDEVPETREVHIISSDKLMVTLTWNSDGSP